MPIMSDAPIENELNNGNHDSNNETFHDNNQDEDVHSADLELLLSLSKQS